MELGAAFLAMGTGPPLGGSRKPSLPCCSWDLQLQAASTSPPESSLTSTPTFEAGGMFCLVGFCQNAHSLSHIVLWLLTRECLVLCLVIPSVVSHMPDSVLKLMLEASGSCGLSLPPNTRMRSCHLLLALPGSFPTHLYRIATNDQTAPLAMVKGCLMATGPGIYLGILP